MTSNVKFSVFNAKRGMVYHAIRELGRGGQASVWLGVDAAGSPIAIKVITPSSNYARDYWSWFNDQQIHLLCHAHQHVVRTYDQFRSAEGHYILVMEPAIRSLDSIIASGFKQSALRICAIGCQILSALDYMHSSINAIHRDVTPKNILEFGNGIVKLNDFGIAKGNIRPGEATGTNLGNQSYLPPELLVAGRWTHQSDIYQLGLVLLSLLLGRHVIPPNLPGASIARMILDGTPRQTADSSVKAYGDLAIIISKMICRTESLRYGSARVAWTALHAEYGRQEKLAQASRNSLVAIAAAVGGLALLAAITAR